MPAQGTTPSITAIQAVSGTQATTQRVNGHTDHHRRPSGENVRLCVTEYAKHNIIQRRYSQSVLDFCRLAFSTEPDPSQQFLDVGCGTGDFTRDVLMPQCLPCRRIVGVDCSREMVEYARRHSAHEKLRFELLDICADVTWFLEKFGQFERVYSFFCLHWVDDISAAFKNISRLMSATGECLLVFSAAQEPVELCKVAVRMYPWAKYSETLQKFILKTHDMKKSDMLRFVSRLLQGAGLFPTIMEALTSTMFDGWSEDDIFAAYKAISPISHLLTDQEKPAWDTFIRDQVRKLHAPDAGRGQCRMFVVKASKSPPEYYEKA
ncbi:juvenile hormone acid O-methyltransferase [Rhipicephalus microplus]|uniref:juvenile hormone acid O-methyltransferase n=1 Tax=Rhipicephalus microplus TaxID=6941 RepID=UPI003F6D4834